MKKLAASLLLCSIALSSSALIEGDGYYRVQNYKTERYIYVLDNKGELNMQATTAELGAIELWKDYNKTISDPATVIYVTDLTGKKQDYDLQTQGTGVKAIINHEVSIYYYKNNGFYSIFGRNSGLTKYIGDGTRANSAQGWVASLDNNEYYRWYFHPITTDDSNYFGVDPEFDADGKHYTSLYADFPFTFSSAGMKAYYVTTVADGKAYLKEINGTVPRATPVIIECSATGTANNKLNIGGSASGLTDNKLQGVYFCNHDLVHKNRKENDPKTMRVPGKLSDGSFGFVTSTEQYLPRNKAYIVVPEGTPSELHITTAEPAGIVEAAASSLSVRIDGLTLYVYGVESAEVYNITGSRVAGVSGDGSSVILPSAGLYLVKAGNNVTKVLAR